MSYSAFSSLVDRIVGYAGIDGNRTCWDDLVARACRVSRVTAEAGQLQRDGQAISEQWIARSERGNHRESETEPNLATPL